MRVTGKAVQTAITIVAITFATCIAFSQAPATAQWSFAALTVSSMLARQGLIFAFVYTNAQLAPDDRVGMMVSVPREQLTDAALNNLKKIIASKETLIMKSLGVISLHFYESDGQLNFPWFILTEADGEGSAHTRLNAYSHFISALCDMAMRQKRVVAREREIVNEKFAMRVFLIRLGFIGAKYKTARRVLLRNLSGNSAWKYGAPTRQLGVQDKNVL